MSDVISSVSHFELSTAQTVALVAAVYVAYLAWSYRDKRAIGTRPRSDLFTVPGQQWMFLGDLPTMVKNQDRQLDRFIEIREKYKDTLQKDPSRAVSITLPWRRMIEASKPEYLEYIQRTNFNNFVKGDQFYKNLSGLLGDGIFCVDGHSWQLQRKTTAKIFTANNFKGVITQSLENQMAKLIAIIGRHADRGEEFDLQDLFFRFTLNSFAEMAFGKDIGALNTESDEPVPFAKAFDYGQVVMNRRFMNPFWPVTEFLDGTHWKMAAATKVMDSFAYGVIEEREREGRGNFTGAQKKEAAEKDLLSLYMALRDDNGAPLTRKMLRDAILNLIIAGRDTTAQALSWTFFHLLSNPKHIEAIRKETDNLGEVGYDTFKQMTTTTAVFQEGLRLHPSVPKNAWEALGPDVLPNGGPRIEKGDIVFWSDWTMNRDPKVWGPDAAEFKPERWLDSEGNLVKESQWKYHAFNGGYRLCLGQNLALYEGTSVLNAVTREFDLSFAPGYFENVKMCDFEQTPLYKGALTLSLAEPLRVKATRRKRA
ncbi:putative cytochrome P450 monooxygenase [Rhodotorula toruloides ATCC 204091]|uniref:Putative cytochrome P450 monooxygenase n=1 Tax=Rhodotorula toruloides TaxID=5286 RepID=A0A0K3C8D8_RHOTO|nr:putative cytochrome P450 monooxygenase [Rhodotorula toruloides ATCC 204091]KAK4335544.1 putative cytochrome P450 monooxygenase [Rhodotorula toruloides]PRQ78120.1 putative cytochrome P450 monooxygenase [Rhodotorula toruloides]